MTETPCETCGRPSTPSTAIVGTSPAYVLLPEAIVCPSCTLAAFCCGRPVVEIVRDDNDDRTRSIVTCKECGTRWMGCLAKRLDREGRDLWGPVGVQSWLVYE